MTRHLPHLLMLGMPLAVFAVVFALEWRRGAPPRPHRAPNARTALLALGTLGSAAVHLSVTGDHLAESTVLGAFFLLLALTQTGYVVLLVVAPRRRVVLAGVLGNGGVVGLWAWTRLVGVPLGLGARERVGTADLLATGCEAVAVVGGLLVLHTLRDRPGRTVAPAPGLEPGTVRLTVECSAN